MAVTAISLPGLVDGNGAPAKLACTDAGSGVVTLSVTTGGAAKLYMPGLVDGAAQNTPVYLKATSNGGGVYTLNTA